MAFAFVQEAHNFSYVASGNPKVTTASPVTKGNLLVAWCSSDNAQNSYVPDDGRNTWVLMVAPTAGGYGSLTGWYCIAESTRVLNLQFFGDVGSGIGGGGFQATGQVTLTHAACQIMEFSGNSQVPLQSAGFATGTSTAPAKAVGATANGLVIGIAIPDTTGDTLVETIGWTNAAGLLINDSAIYQIVGGAGTYTPTFLMGANASWGCLGAAFNVPGATHTIAGALGVSGAGALVSFYCRGVGTLAGTSVADGSGNYTSPGLEDALYTVQPVLNGVVFSSNTLNVTVSGANVTGQNFTSTAVNTSLILSPMVADTMKRANENPLSNGGTWIVNGEGDPGLQLVSNEAIEVQSVQISNNNPSPFAGDGIGVWTGTNFPSDQYSQIQIDQWNTTPLEHAKWFCAARADSAGHVYYLGGSNNGDGTCNLMIFRFDNAAGYQPFGLNALGNRSWGEQLFGFWTLKNHPYSLGDNFSLACVGTTFYALHNGAVIGTCSDSDHNLGGVRIILTGNQTSDVQFSNFVAGSVELVGGGMGSFVQGVGQVLAGQASPATLAYTTQNNGTGNLLVCVFRCNASVTVPTVSDSVNGNWTVQYASGSNSQGGGYAYFLNNASNGVKLTVTITQASGAGIVMALAEYSGVNAARNAAAWLANNASQSTTQASNTISDNAGDLVIGGVSLAAGVVGNVASVTLGGGAGILREFGENAGAAVFCAIGDNTNAAGSATDSASFTLNTTEFGGAGVAAFFQQTAATPTFSPVAGTYGSAQTVTISSTTPGGTIYYTTDGSTPTISSSSISNGGTVTVSSSLTLKAIEVASGFANSAVGSAVYVIQGGFVAVGWSPVDSRIAVKGFGPAANTGIVDSQGNTIYSAQKPPFTGNSQVSNNVAIPPVDSRAAGAPVESRVSVPKNSRKAPPF